MSDKLCQWDEFATSREEINAVNGLAAIAIHDVHSTFNLCRTW
jgi:hypothetical protein